MNLIRRLFCSDDKEPELLERDRKIFAVSSGISRRSFLRTAGVLGTAILVAPSLITLEQPAYGRSLTAEMLDHQSELSRIFREVYRDAVLAIPDVTPLSARSIQLARPYGIDRMPQLTVKTLAFNVRLRR